MKIYFEVEPIEAGAQNRRRREEAAIDRLVERIAPGKKLVHEEYGAPLLEGSSVSVSVSHSRRFAALAWADRPISVGVDIEEMRPGQLERVAGRFLAAEEVDFYGASPERLLRAWTLKEAAYKAMHNGPADLRLYRLQPWQESRVINVGDVELGIAYSDWVEDGVYLSVVVKDPELRERT